MRLARLGVVGAALLVLAASSPVPIESPGRLAPVAAGPSETLSTELGYEAFPFAAVDSASRTWVAYNHGSGHVSATGDVRVRYADPGRTWSPPSIMVAASEGYGVGAAGIAAETAAQGGRLWLSTIRFLPTSSATATNYTTSVRFWDPTLSAWSTPALLPAISATQTIGTGLLVRPDGQVLAAAYGTPAGGSHMVGRVYAYDRAAGTWSARSTVTIAGRHLQEPTLVTMADGRLLMLARSDANQPYYCRIYAAVSADDGVTWSTPHLIVVHGSGMPTGYVLPTGEIAVSYRGFSQPANPAASYPPRITMLDPSGQAYGEHLDILPTDRRYLYGQITRGPPGEPDRWVYAVEAPDGQAGGGAAIYSVPLRWAVRS